MLALLVNRSMRKGSKGKTIVSPSRSFNSVINALSRVGILGFAKAYILNIYLTILQTGAFDCFVLGSYEK